MAQKTGTKTPSSPPAAKKKRKAPAALLAKSAPKWEKGVSGNPNGRPRGARNRSTIFREWLECKAEDGAPGTKADEIARAQIRKATKGDTRAAEFVIDSAHGRLKEVHEHTGADGGPILKATAVATFTDDEAARVYRDMVKRPVS